MAKMFYTMEETKSALGRNEEDIKQLAREGRLREFRDGPRLMFKADQVEQLKGELGGAGGGGDAVSLNPAESGAPIGLVDSRNGSSGGSSLGGPAPGGSVGGLNLNAGSLGGSALGLVDSTAGTRAGQPAQTKEDTHFADIGLSGSFGGVPSPNRPGDTRGATGLSGGTGLSAGGTRAGITVFDVDESQRVDPSAQTAISQGAQEQINLEGVGSGSGLLDLTRESDDTSLGAVFDELTPTAGARRSSAPSPTAALETQAGEDIVLAAPMERRSSAPTVFVEAPDPMGTAIAVASIGATITVVLGGFLLAAAIMGYRPAIMNGIKENFMMYVGVAVGLTVILFVVGMFVGKSSRA
jgi:hypothetical protein